MTTVNLYLTEKVQLSIRDEHLRVDCAQDLIRCLDMELATNKGCWWPVPYNEHARGGWLHELNIEGVSLKNPNVRLGEKIILAWASHFKSNDTNF